jgi:Tol biopolymer transport system component
MQLVSKNLNGVTSNDLTQNADIDATGRYIVFESESTILVNISTTFNRSHIYRKDTVTGEVLLVSSDKSGLVEANRDAYNPSISSNGRYVVFQSLADNLDGNTNGVQQIYLKDLDTNDIVIASRNESGVPDNGLSGASNASVSDDGRYVLFQTSDATMSVLNSSTCRSI